MDINSYMNSTAVIWTKSTCPYCIMAKKLLKSKNIPFIEHDLLKNATMKDLLKVVPNAKTVPQIFLNGKYIGGYTDLKDYFDKIDKQSNLITQILNINSSKNLKKDNKEKKMKKTKKKPIEIEDKFAKYKESHYMKEIFSPKYRAGTMSYISRSKEDQEKYDEKQLYLRLKHDLDKIANNADGSPNDEVDFGDPYGF